MKSVLEVATTQEDVITPTPEAPIVTSEIRQLLTCLAPVLLRGTSAPPLVFERTSITIVETGSGSALLVPTPAMDILKN